jgi:hypothetical protein
MPFHEIKYNKNLLDSKYFPLMIFHEIWHVINASKLDNDYYSLRKVITRWAELDRAKENKEVQEDYRNNYLNHRSQDERQAWFVAYKLLKSLESKWYNIFDDLSKEDVFNFINMSLKSYKYSGEMNRFKDISNTKLFSAK